MISTIKSFLLSCLSLCLLVCVFNFSYAQVPINQQISYEDFVQQCINFKKRPLDQRQEVWVFHFWASWHNISQTQVSELKGLLESYKNKPVRLISISTDKLPGNWISALRKHNMPWEQVNVPREDDLDYLKSAFKHNSLPALFVMESDGLVRRLPAVSDVRSFLNAVSPRLPDRPYYAFPNAPESSRPQGNQNDNPNHQPGSGEWVIHTVESGDTLFSLYRRYGVAVDEIKQLNGLTSNALSIGQKLKIKRH